MTFYSSLNMQVMEKLTKENLLKVKSTISKLKRVGFTVKPDTHVMTINGKEIDYRTFKKLLKTIK